MAKCPVSTTASTRTHVHAHTHSHTLSPTHTHISGAFTKATSAAISVIDMPVDPVGNEMHRFDHSKYTHTRTHTHTLSHTLSHALYTHTH